MILIRRAGMRDRMVADELHVTGRQFHVQMQRGIVRQRGTTAFHLMGTCRMASEGDRSTVVSDELKVHGIEGLRVVDASIMPAMPSANTNASTLMIVEKAAYTILGKPPLPAAV
jgi:choline dehydrogenase-like flavoprotein